MNTVTASHFVLATADWLFGLSRLSFSDERAVIGWRYSLPAWAWVVIALAAVGFTWWSYRRLIGPLAARLALAGIRSLIFVVVAILIAGPMLVITQEHVEPDWLLMLVDRSASMAIKDMPADNAVDSTMVSRYQTLQQAIEQQRQVFGPEQLGKDRRILWLGFDSSTFEITPPYELAEQNVQPAGRTTALRTAIEQAMQRAAGRPVSGIVLLSDGRSAQQTGAAIIRQLQQQAVGIYAVPLGSNAAPIDLAIAQVQSPTRAFINDIVPVTVQLDMYGETENVDLEKVRVQLVDPLTDRILDEKTLAQSGIDQPVHLSTQSSIVGPINWRVQVVYESDKGRGELVTDNNSELVSIELIDRPIRVLYVEGYPRWEYRYLKNLLLREESIECSILLVSADQDFAQEGDRPIARLPRDEEEFSEYDVVIIGDVPTGYFSSNQYQLIRKLVAERGAGLMWIAGPAYTPATYTPTELVDLLPMIKPSLVKPFNTSSTSITVEPTLTARTLQVLNLRDPSQSEDSQYWPDYLAPLQWVQNLGELKPTAEILARGKQDLSQQATPIVVQMRYGAGKVIYVATEETWRWRRGRGEVFFEQFWVQLTRMLGRNRVQQQQRAVLQLANRRVQLGQTVPVDLRIDDATLAQRNLPTIDVTIEQPDDIGTPNQKLELLPLDQPLGDQSQSGRRYRALWRADEAGSYRLRVVEPALDDLNLFQEIEVVHPADELRQPAPDHDRLATLAQQTAGQVIPVNQLDQLTQLIPNRARRTPNDITEPLWDSPLALLVLLVLLTAEWVGRKVIRLV